MRRAVYVLAGKCFAIVGVRDLGEASVKTQVRGQLDRSLPFPPVGSAWTLEFEGSVVRDIDLLVRAVNQENICAQRKSAQIMRCAELVEICGRYFWRFGAFDDSARILARDASSV